MPIERANVTGVGLRGPEGNPAEELGRFYSSMPAATGKNQINNGPRRSEYIETMARLLVDVPPSKLEELQNSLPAETLATSNTLLFSNENLTQIINGNAPGSGYFDFLLTGITQQRAEREQVVDTLTDNTVIYYGGESAPVLSCSGVFLNTYQDDQNVWFHLLYTDILRGTMLARRGLVARFKYDSFFMTGYLTNLQTALVGGAEGSIQFSFTFRVKQIQVATPIFFNPQLSAALIRGNLFSSSASTAADNTTRHGVETTPDPMAPIALPAATVITRRDTDPRETDARIGLTPQMAQRVTDAAIAEESAAAASQQPTDPAEQQSLDEATTPVMAASGDVRQQLPPAQAAQFQSFSITAPSTPELGARAEARLPGLIDASLRAADTRGTVVVSPVTGGLERTSATADTIARATPVGVTNTASSGSAVTQPGPGTPPATNADDQSLDEVYRPTPALVQAYQEARITTVWQPENPSAAPRPRSRQRP